MSPSRPPVSRADIEKYSHPIPDRDYIMGVLSDNNRPMTRSQLGRALQLDTDEQKEGLRRRLRAMERDGQLSFHPRNGYSLIDESSLISGRVIGHPDGFGFLSRDEGGDDLFLADSQMLQVFDGDRVAVRISGTDRRGRQEGSIVKVLERNTRELVGQLDEEDGEHFLRPENRRIAHEIEIAARDLKGAKAGQYVSVEITEQPSSRFNAAGKVTEVLGDAMAPGMEIDIAIRSHNIPHRWPRDVLAAADQLGDEVAEADKLHRKDLRQLPFVTIDGEDARDFDDAVYCRKSRSGGWHLYVAIADVSHYVAPGSALDSEAHERATSVYFPGHVVPMLPESLSNGLCSLNPQVDRLVMVCHMRISASGKMTDFRFSEGLIHSHARLTYNQVGALLCEPESDLGQQTRNRYSELVPHLSELHNLYGALRKARTKRGSIDFEKQEVSFRFTDDRKIDQIVPVERNDAHKMIEEFMLCANVATARFLEKLQIPALYRVHGGPNATKLAALRAFLAERGLKLAGGDQPTPKHYDQLLSSLGDRNDAHIIRTMMLRSLNQAEYSPDNLGHFGLAYAAYAHFTSPIRRYPDLLVHRAIRSIIRQRESGGPLRRTFKRITRIGKDPVFRIKSATSLNPGTSYPYDLAAMLTLAEHCSEASRRADKASWDVDAWLKCEYMQDFIGETFTGVVASLTNFGLFIELEDIQVEGLIHISALKDDYYQFDPAQQRMVGERHHRSFGLGDSVDIRVVQVDMEQRKIAFEFAQQEEAPKPRKKRHYRNKKRNR